MMKNIALSSIVMGVAMTAVAATMAAETNFEYAKWSKAQAGDTQDAGQFTKTATTLVVCPDNNMLEVKPLHSYKLSGTFKLNELIIGIFPIKILYWPLMPKMI